MFYSELEFVYRALVIQSWIFAFKYLQSALKSSKMKWPKKELQVIKWLGILVYCGLIFILLILFIVYVPIETSFESSGNRLFFYSDIAWPTIAVISAVITLAGIYKICSIIQKLQEDCSSICVNNTTMIIHIVLLFAESVAIIVRVIIVRGQISFHSRLEVYSSLFTVDLLV